jgi:hypothetical protein
VKDTNIIDIAKNKNYTFDQVFTPENDNHFVFDNLIEPIIWKVMEGYNGIIK